MIKVESIEATLAELARQGIAPDAPPGSPAGEIRTAWITDPDGTRIELVEWPPGHRDGLRAADFRPA